MKSGTSTVSGGGDLQLQSHPSIFTLGDITDLQEAKQFPKTAGHASVVVPNVLSYLEGEPEELCKPRRLGEIIMISNGRVSFF
jgi:NADH dehydrogenase FAD-containing subunit